MVLLWSDSGICRRAHVLIILCLSHSIAVKLLLLETVRNAAPVSLSTAHTWHGHCWFSALPTSTLAMLPGHLSSVKRPVLWRTALFLLTAETGHGDVRFFHSFIPFSEAGSHRAETLMMPSPVELVVVWMLGDAVWLSRAGGLLFTGPWRPSPSGLRSGGAGRLMIAVVIRLPLQLILLLLSSLRFRLERPDKLKYGEWEKKTT